MIIGHITHLRGIYVMYIFKGYVYMYYVCVYGVVLFFSEVLVINTATLLRFAGFFSFFSISVFPFFLFSTLLISWPRFWCIFVC